MRTRSISLALAALALVTGGCTDERSSFYISGNVFPQLQDGVCTYDVGNADRLSGVWDVSFGNAYYVFPRYENTARNRAKGIVADTSGIRVQGVEVTLLDGAGNEIAEYSVPTSSFLPSSPDGINPGRTSGAVPLIPPGVPVPVGDFLVAEVVAFGTTLGGAEVESSPWMWVVQVCNGCLRACAAEGEQPQPVCSAGSDEVLLLPATHSSCQNPAPNP